MDFRKIFNDKVAPKDFDKFRFRYCDELFADVIAHSKLNATKTALEIGPGTGQATEPILKTNCSYLAIELGENFADDMKKKFNRYKNFNIVNADFETYPFEKNMFDLVYSAATIQWIPEEIAFPKVYHILKSNGTLAMFMTHTDYRTSNEALYEKIQDVYSQFFKPETAYTKKFDYYNAVNYGFVDFERREYHQVKECTADEYVSFISIYAANLTIPEPYKSKFLNGIRNAILSFGNKITLNNTIILYLARKP
ncbi:MAG TPA: SAM-dependent methyltransferase [Ruminococcaceae bacterium]|jgi:trans-aconitate methyltransferase|nr:SAM-dependent methyltransferase [Oscillospiraceae bacterium]